MSKSKRETRGFRRKGARADTPVIGPMDPVYCRVPVEVFDGVYDALDHRLMATFPASDATAQY